MYVLLPADQFCHKSIPFSAGSPPMYILIGLIFVRVLFPQVTLLVPEDLVGFPLFYQLQQRR